MSTPQGDDRIAMIRSFIDTETWRTYLGPEKFRMGRYYVVLQAAPDAAPYVVGEVVRELDDDGRYREASLAANIAGPQALICTEEELGMTEVGRSLLRRWKAGNDHSFHLDTLSLVLPEHSRPRPGLRHLSSAERDELHAQITTRCEAVRRHGEFIRGENQRLIADLRANVEQLKQRRLRCRETLAFVGPKVQREPRRHLRSVS
jgi:hypothetical protein